MVENLNRTLTKDWFCLSNSPFFTKKTFLIPVIWTNQFSRSTLKNHHSFLPLARRKGKSHLFSSAQFTRFHHLKIFFQPRSSAIIKMMLGRSGLTAHIVSANKTREKNVIPIPIIFFILKLNTSVCIHRFYQEHPDVSIKGVTLTFIWLQLLYTMNHHNTILKF